MADLAVSDVLDDPDFRSSFSLIRSTTTVSDQGMGSKTKTTSTVFGVVQPAGARDLDRLPDLARQGGTIQVWTRFALNLDAPSQGADRIVWMGSTYTVMTCDPWAYGSGYWRSLASLDSLS